MINATSQEIVVLGNHITSSPDKKDCGTSLFDLTPAGNYCADLCGGGYITNPDTETDDL